MKIMIGPKRLFKNSQMILTNLIVNIIHDFLNGNAGNANNATGNTDNVMLAMQATRAMWAMWEA